MSIRLFFLFESKWPQFAIRKVDTKKDSNSYKEKHSYLKSRELLLRHIHLCVPKAAYYYINRLHPRTIEFLKLQLSRKQISFWNSFKVQMLSLIDQATHMQS